MNVVLLVLGVLAVWRVTHFLYAEDGPWRIVARARDAMSRTQVFQCFYCLSLWVSAPISALIATNWTEGILMWLALSAGSIMIERILPPEARYREDERTREEPDP